MEVVEKKEIVHKDVYGGHESKDYASKGVAGSGLGLGIAGTALGLLALNRGGGLFGGGSSASTAQLAYDVASNANLQYVERKESQDYVDITSKYYEGRIDSLKNLSSAFYDMDKKITDSSFGLYKNQRDQFDALASRIGQLETQVAVNSAIAPYKEQITQMQIANVAGSIVLEAERRECADTKMVNYMNTMFYPVSVANITTGTTATQRSTFNPLCDCACASNGTVTTSATA